MGRCYNSVVVDAPCDEVWQALRNFHDMSWAPEVITSITAVGDKKAGQTGAKRVLNEAFHETLLSLDDDDHTLSYSIDDGPGPVAKGAVDNYVGTVRARPVTDSNATFVEWESSYASSDDKAVGEFCDPIYQALLSGLKNHFANG